MIDRIHLHLDGDLPAEALTPAERARAAELRAAVEAAASALRVRAPAGLSRRVMAAILGEQTGEGGES